MRKLASVVVLVALGLPAVVLGVAHLQGWRPVVERSDSMAPVMDQGDLVLVTPMDATRMRPGEIVTFAHPSHDGRTLTHRVTAVQQVGGTLRVTSRGDANPAPESWTIDAAGTVGHVAGHIPLPRLVALLTAPTPQRAVSMMLLTLLACATTLAAIWRRPVPATACARRSWS